MASEGLIESVRLTELAEIVILRFMNIFVMMVQVRQMFMRYAMFLLLLWCHQHFADTND